MTDGLEVVIAARQDLAQIALLDIVPLRGTLPPATAGAHVDVQVEEGLTRQYSLCGDPGRTDRYRLAILREPASRGGSSGVHARFRVGDRIRIGRPRNQFPLDWNASRSLLVGGGIGITPLLAMAFALHRAGRRFDLHYCARTRERAAFAPELAASPFADRVQLHLSAEPQSGRFDPDRDLGAAEGAALYVCGPTGFMERVLDGAVRAGFAPGQLHRESFKAGSGTAAESFEIVARRSGRRIDVGPGQRMTEALALAGIKVAVSCEQGICGTCLATVLEGTPEHRDTYLTPDERAANDQVLLCCSGSRSPVLVLDL